MSEGQVLSMTNMRSAGISTPKVYGFFASQAGGYDKVGFRKKVMYNRIDKEKRMGDGDANGALLYLSNLSRADPMLQFKYEEDGDGCLRQLFWADAKSQVDYEVFGDVLAFDATYGKNKYKCPLIVFAGVNNHLQTIVFGSAVVSDESEPTYVWVLEQFLEVMRGKCPKSVITDGDLSMKNAIRKVFPEAHHRLCGWHLLRNATSNVSKPKFNREFKKCMLGDYEVDEFEERWKSMVSNFGVQDVSWVQDMYEKKEMWATAHMRGKFFAGLRTTSRCEALHSQVGRYVEAGCNMTELLLHFVRFLDYIRNNEKEADYKSSFGFPVMQSQLQSLERSAACVYSREVFYLFRSLLLKASNVKVVAWKETSTVAIFVVSKYCDSVREWHVSYCPATNEMRCSCQRMESFGIPCVHMISVMVYIDLEKVPDSLILKRWTMKALEGVEVRSGQGFASEDSCYVSRVVSMNESWRELTVLACRTLDDFNDIMDWLANKKAHLVAKNESQLADSQGGGKSPRSKVKDPRYVRTKGCGRTSSSMRGKNKRIVRCSLCRGQGHNRRKCPRRGTGVDVSDSENDEVDGLDGSDDGDEWEDDDMDCRTSIGDGVLDL